MSKVSKGLLLGAVFCTGFGATLFFAVKDEEPAVARAQGTAELIIFSGKNFEGRSLVVTDTLPDLPSGEDPNGTKYTWNDGIGSIIVVSGTWRLYQEGRCNTVLDGTPIGELDLSTKAKKAGWSCLVSATALGAREIPSADVGLWDDDISSIELVSERNLPDWAFPRR